MNDPRTCVYGHARKISPVAPEGACTRPRGLPCLCGLVKARVPEPMPDKLAPAQGAASPWTHTYSGKPVPQPWPFPGPQSRLFNVEGTTTGRITSREPHLEELPRVAQRSLGLEDLDLGNIEQRVLALCTCEEAAEIKQQAWDALGRCPRDNWKPGRDVS